MMEKTAATRVDQFLSAAEAVRADTSAPAGALARLIKATDMRALFNRLVRPDFQDLDRVFGQKYLALHRFIARHDGYARSVGLDRAAPSRVLDLGAGAGFFCFAARAYGHGAVAVEPSQDGRAPAIDFAVMLDWLGVPHSQQAIVRQIPLALDAVLAEPDGTPRRFDLITAFAAMFNYWGHGRREDDNEAEFWDAADYLFFFDDMRRFLAPGGKLHIKFNGQPFGQPKEGKSPGVVRYYQSLGKLLEPYLVERNAETGGVTLDLSRSSGGPPSPLDIPDPEETRLAEIKARNVEIYRRNKRARRRAGSPDSSPCDEAV
jgi:SAM-dependent methyltransferase